MTRREKRDTEGPMPERRREIDDAVWRWLGARDAEQEIDDALASNIADARTPPEQAPHHQLSTAPNIDP